MFLIFSRRFPDKVLQFEIGSRSLTLVALHGEPTTSANARALSAHDAAFPYSIELHRDFESARAAWADLDAHSQTSPYQRFRFCRDWAETIGASLGIEPLIAVARNPGDAPAALLPLGLHRSGPLTTATVLGGRMANYQMGLFRAGTSWGPELGRVPLARSRAPRRLRSLCLHQSARALARRRQPDRASGPTA